MDSLVDILFTTSWALILSRWVFYLGLNCSKMVPIKEDNYQLQRRPKPLRSCWLWSRFFFGLPKLHIKYWWLWWYIDSSSWPERSFWIAWVSMFLDCTLLTWQLEKSPIGVASLGSNRPRKFVAAMASSTPFGGGVAAANGMVKLMTCIHDHPWFSQGNPRMPWLTLW